MLNSKVNMVNIRLMLRFSLVNVGVFYNYKVFKSERG